MSYIGNQPPDIGAYDVESFDGGGTSFTLKRSATVSSVLLFIDGVRQTPTDAYTVSGVTLTTTGTTPAGTDNVTVMFMGDVVDIGAPSSDTVSTATIQDDAVTAAKLANSINTEIAANTAKVTNATHTGDVTGATALTIAVDAVDIAMLSATGTADATTFLRGDNSWVVPGGGKVLQAVTATYATNTVMSTTSYVTSGLSCSITPASTDNKILIFTSGMCRVYAASAASGRWVQVRLYRVTDTTQIIEQTTHNADTESGTSQGWTWVQNFCTLDSPSTTSAVEYRIDGKVSNATYHRLVFQNEGSTSTLTLLEIEG